MAVSCKAEMAHRIGVHPDAFCERHQRPFRRSCACTQSTPRARDSQARTALQSAGAGSPSTAPSDPAAALSWATADRPPCLDLPGRQQLDQAAARQVASDQDLGQRRRACTGQRSPCSAAALSTLMRLEKGP